MCYEIKSYASRRRHHYVCITEEAYLQYNLEDILKRTFEMFASRSTSLNNDLFMFQNLSVSSFVYLMEHAVLTVIDEEIAENIQRFLMNRLFDCYLIISFFIPNKRYVTK